VPTESEPRGFAISPDGRSLIAVGQASHRLSRYAIDGASGRLRLVASHPVGRNPNWVEILELPR
jgi:6-phosphogluconolactonase